MFYTTNKIKYPSLLLFEESTAITASDEESTLDEEFTETITPGKIKGQLYFNLPKLLNKNKSYLFNYFLDIDENDNIIISLIDYQTEDYNISYNYDFDEEAF